MNDSQIAWCTNNDACLERILGDLTNGDLCVCEEETRLESAFAQLLPRFFRKTKNIVPVSSPGTRILLELSFSISQRSDVGQRPPVRYCDPVLRRVYLRLTGYQASLFDEGGMSFLQPSESSCQPITADEFVALLVKCERRVRGFIATLHPHSYDVDEIVQDTSVVAWKKLTSFRYSKQTPDEEFVRWICMIARLELNNFRRKRGHADLIFDDELLDKLSDQYLTETSRLEERHEALMECVNRLHPRDQDMVKRRYQVGISARELATCAGRTVDAIYKTLSRIRGTLLVCIEKSLKEEGVR